MNVAEITTVLKKHMAWLQNEQGGERADLYGADLYRADLYEARNIIVIGPIGSRGDLLYVVLHEATRMYKTGCFWGNEQQFIQAVETQHDDNKYAQAYRAVVEMAKVLLPVAGGGTPAARAEDIGG